MRTRQFWATRKLAAISEFVPTTPFVYRLISACPIIGKVKIHISGKRLSGMRIISEIREVSVLGCGSFRHLKFSFLSPHTAIKIAAKLYPVHGLSSGIQAKDMFIGLFYLNPASSSLFSCKFARKSRFSPRIVAAVDDFLEK